MLSYLRGAFLQANISSNNNSATHTIDHLYWDFVSLCHLMSMEKACLAYIVDSFLPPTHSHTHRHKERHGHTHAIDGNLPRMRFLFNHNFVCTLLLGNLFGKEKKISLSSRLYCDCGKSTYMCIWRGTQKHTRTRTSNRQ